MQRPSGSHQDAGSDAISVGPLRLSKATFRRAIKRARSDLQTLEQAAKQQPQRLLKVVRARRGGSATARPDRRPDGSAVPPALVPAAPARRDGAIEKIVAPVAEIRTALRDRWQDAMREGKLAAKEKEAEIRAEYEQRVRHDPRLHAIQHGVKKD
jgi:hypothetical protein